MEPQTPHTREPRLRSYDEPPLAAIPVEDLARTVLEREKLDPQELARCRCEVLLQLAHSSPWSERNASEAAYLDHEHMLVVYRARNSADHA